MTMECIYCKGTLERGKTSHVVTRDGYHLILDDVPAWVCGRCGEPLFDEQTVAVIQDIVGQVDKRLAALSQSPAAA